MGVTRGQLPQRAGLPGLNGSGTAAAVPPTGVVQSKYEKFYLANSHARDFSSRHDLLHN